MSAALRKPATWVLAAALVILSQTGTRCGDAYRPDMTARPVVIDR
jgi:hypothetical protein